MNRQNDYYFKLQQIVKRVIDSALAAVVLILTSPFLAAIALVIKLDSPGEVIFRHKRIGKDGKPFILYKFRSMAKGGDDSGYMNYLQELIESERNGNSQKLPYRKMDDDLRVTQVGKLLRRFYLDELPQLINVLRGEMSWVGPRPHVQFEVANYTPTQHRRLSVKPGCTGLWQVEGKADCTFSELIQLDLEYIDNWSLILDLQIMVKTFLIMLRGGEACWARMAKRVPARKPAVSTGRTFVESPGGVRIQTLLDQNWFVEVPEKEEEFADENR